MTQDQLADAHTEIRRLKTLLRDAIDLADRYAPLSAQPELDRLTAGLLADRQPIQQPLAA